MIIPIGSTGVPQTVTRFQAQAVLDAAGHYDAIEAVMNNPATPRIVRIAWQSASVFERHSPMVLAIAQQLGLTDAQIDQLFITASEIRA